MPQAPCSVGQASRRFTSRLSVCFRSCPQQMLAPALRTRGNTPTWTLQPLQHSPQTRRGDMKSSAQTVCPAFRATTAPLCIGSLRRPQSRCYAALSGETKRTLSTTSFHREDRRENTTRARMLTVAVRAGRKELESLGPGPPRRKTCDTLASLAHACRPRITT
jgi:hypothetical protein